MAGNPIHILCTRPVNKALIEDAVAKGITVDVIEYIQTAAIVHDKLLSEVQSIATKKCNVIFTSMNAVKAVKNLLQDVKPRWNIFCMGNTTKQLVINYFGENSIKGTGINATDLAHYITSWSKNSNEKNDWVFFCGDQRREELPRILKEHHFELNELTVYETIETPHKAGRFYNAVLFFSPSAVHSFFKLNHSNETTVYYAIGETTACSIQQYGANKIIKGQSPAKDELFRLCIDNFSIPGMEKASE